MLGTIFDFFYSTERPFSLVINIIIPALAVVALAQLIKNASRLRNERQTLDRVRRLSSLSTSGDMIEKASAEIGASGLVARRLREVTDARRRGVEINHQLLAAVTAGELDEQVAFAKWIAPSLVLLGLLGTLLGLSQATQSVDAILHGQTATLASLRTAITGTFGGIKVAFSATTMGVLWTILVGLILSRIRKRQNAFIRDLEALTGLYLLPHFQTSVGTALVQTAQKLTLMEGRLDSALKEVIDAVHLRGQGLTLTVETRLQELSTGFSTTSGQLLARFQAAAETLQQLLGVPAADQRPLMENMRQLQGAVVGLSEAVDLTRQSLPSLGETIARQVDRQTGDIHEALTAYSSQVTEIAERQEEVLSTGLEQLRTLVPAIGETVARQVDQQSTDLNEALAGYTTSIQNSVSSQGEQLERVEELLVSLADSARRVTDALSTVEQAAGSGAATFGALQSAITDLERGTAALSESLPTRLAATLAEHRDGDGEGDHARELTSAVRSLDQSIQRLAVSSRGSTPQQSVPARPSLFRRLFG